jgi:hypothetical protein
MSDPVNSIPGFQLNRALDYRWLVSCAGLFVLNSVNAIQEFNGIEHLTIDLSRPTPSWSLREALSLK